jgi:hypothetical protein
MASEFRAGARRVRATAPEGRRCDIVQRRRVQRQESAPTGPRKRVQFLPPGASSNRQCDRNPPRRIVRIRCRSCRVTHLGKGKTASSDRVSARQRRRANVLGRRSRLWRCEAGIRSSRGTQSRREATTRSCTQSGFQLLADETCSSMHERAGGVGGEHARAGGGSVLRRGDFRHGQLQADIGAFRRPKARRGRHLLLG